MAVGSVSVSLVAGMGTGTRGGWEETQPCVERSRDGFHSEETLTLQETGARISHDRWSPHYLFSDTPVLDMG